MNLFKNNTNNKLLLAFILSIFIYAFNVYSAQRVGSDHLHQLGSAVNFIEGNGFTKLSTQDFNHIDKVDVNAWPYFYRIVSTPVLLITNKNIEITFYIVLVLGYAFFLFSLLHFINKLEIQYKKRIMFLACILIPIITSAIKYGGDIDLFSVGVTLLSLTFLIDFWYKNQKLKYIILFSVFVALLPQMRYAYIPQTLAFIMFFMLVHFFSGKLMKNKSHYLFLFLPVISLVYIIQSPYFQKTSSKIITNTSEKISLYDNFQLWLKPFYAPFFNSFFPDYILFSFLKRFSFYESIVIFIMIGLMIISIIIFISLLRKYLNGINSIKILFEKSKIYQTGLIMIILSTLVFYIYLYKKSLYNIEDINSGLIIYKSLAVVNRYFIPLHISMLLLAIIYSFPLKNTSKFFRVLLFSSISFGLAHYSYLRIKVYSPLDRMKNMDIVNNPPGSYYDILQIGDLIYQEKKSKQVFYISDIDNNSENYRQITPHVFASANAVVFVPKDINLEKYKLNENNVLLQSVNSLTKLEDKNWELEYEGAIYSLYKYKK